MGDDLVPAPRTTQRGSSALVHMACAGAAVFGIPPEELLRSALGRRPSAAALEHHIALDEIDAIWRTAEEATEQSHLPLAVAEAMPVGALGLIDEWASASTTLGDALEVVARCHDLLSSRGAFRVVRRGRRAVFQHTAPSASRHLVELALAMVVERTRRFSGVRWRPIEVRLRYPRVASPQVFEHLFDAPLVLNYPCDEIVFDAELLQLPFLEADTSSARAHEARAAQLLDGLSNRSVDQGWRRDVLETVRTCLLEGNPNLEQVARRLGTSSRSLQRRLKSSGTSHRQLLNEVRGQLANEFFAAGNEGRQALADALAYSDVRSLRRALKRWDAEAYRRPR